MFSAFCGVLLLEHRQPHVDSAEFGWYTRQMHCGQDSASHAARPSHLTGSYRDFDDDDVFWIASQFQIGEIRSLTTFRERGNINLHTFEISNDATEYFLLQRLNTDVFNKPLRVMSAMEEWISAQKNYLKQGRAPEWTVWEPITLVPTHDGGTFLDLSDSSGTSIWRMMAKIGETRTVKSLSEIVEVKERLRVAEEVGRGLALSADLSTPMSTDNLTSSLPGYRDTKGYYRQFHSILSGATSTEEAEAFLPQDPEVREATEMLYSVHLDSEQYRARRNESEVTSAITVFLEKEQSAYEILEAVQSGRIRKTAIHGDTKIDNFLFCRHTGKVRSLVDLDTIMPYTWLADWGDMARSLCNVAGEKERDLTKVLVDRDIYQAVTSGFLTTAKEVKPEEIELMPLAVETIALELGLRFLTDYLRGDTYFLLGDDDPRDLNKTRGLVQLKLHQELVAQRDWAMKCVKSFSIS